MKSLLLLLLILVLTACTGGGGASVDAFLGVNSKKSTGTAPTFSVSLSDGIFNEAAADGGAVVETITVSLSSQNGGAATFAGSIAEDFVVSGYVTVANVPSGLTAHLIKQSDTILSFTMSGTAAAHASTDDINNLQVTFLPSAFDGVSTGTVGGSVQTLAVKYNALQFTYSTSTFQEHTDNDGHIAAAITISLSGDTFTGSNGEIFSGNGKVSVSNIPAGLTASVERTSNTQVTVTLNGNAISHLDTSDINNLTLTFNNPSINSGSASLFDNYSRNNLVINFINPVFITYSASTFYEASSNNGSISTTSTITLLNDTFVGANGTNLITATRVSVSNVPTGLTASIVKTSPTTASMTLTGSAGAHVAGNSISDLTVTFLDGAFNLTATASLVSNYFKNDLNVTYYNQGALTYAASTFNESSANVGGVTDTTTITLANDTFTGAVNENFIATSKVIASNVPTGLTASLIRNSAAQLTLSFTGAATTHTGSVSNVTLTFAASAFAFNSVASTVNNYNKSDLTINFSAPYTLTYSQSTLAEHANNDGSIGDTATLTLAGTTLNGTVAMDFITAGKASVTNTPSGLTARLVMTSATTLTLDFTGNAAAHGNASDISNFTVVLNDGAFTSGESDGVTNSTKNNIAIDFNNTAVLTYFSTSSWYNVSWPYRVRVTIPTASVTGVLSDFPVLVKLSDLPSNFWIHVKADGGDILVTSSDGLTQVPLQLNNFNFGANTGEIFFKAPALSNVTVNEFYIYYGNAAASQPLANAAYGSQNVWNSNYKTVYHLDEISNGTANEIIDSTSFARHMAAPAAGNAPSQMTGASAKLGNAVSFDGSNDMLLSAANATTLGINGANARTVMIWAYTSAFDNSRGMFHVGQAGTNGWDFALRTNGSVDNWRTQIWGQDVDFAAAGSLSTWKHYAIVYTGTNVKAYFNGTLVADQARTIDTQNTDPFQLGRWNTGCCGNQYFSGRIDEVSVANTEFNAAWIAATFSNQNAPSSFYSTGAEQDYTSVPPVFAEAAANIGTIGNPISITLTNLTFNGVPGDDFVAQSKVTVSNVPAGLTATLMYVSSTALSFSLTSAAGAHTNANDVANLTITFGPTAFTNLVANNVTNYIKGTIVVDFKDPASLTYSTAQFDETVANTGLIGNTSTITLTNDTFTGSIGNNFIGTKAFISNLPGGMTATLVKASSNTATLTLSGNATNHANGNDQTALTLLFDISAFTNNTVVANVLNYNRNDLFVNFADPASIAYSATALTEDETNAGAFSNTINLTLTGDTFSSASGANLVAEGKVVVSNYPAGLTPVVTQTSSSYVTTLSFTGTAGPHTTGANSTNMTVAFNAGAFTNNTVAANVLNYSTNTNTMTLRDPYGITYASSAFNESTSDDGSMNNTISISLSGATSFVGATNSDLVAAGYVTTSNLPAGLTAVVTKNTANSLTFALSGSATTNVSASSVSNLGITFLNGAFAGGNATQVTNYTKTDFSINYISSAVPAPTGVAIINSTTTSATVGWTDVPTNEQEYQIDRCNGPSCGTSWITAQSVVGLAANTTSYNFTGLTEGSYYMFRVRAKNSEFTSGWAYSSTGVVFGGIQSSDNGTGTSAEYRAIDCRQQKNTYAVIYWNDLPLASTYNIYDSSSGSDVLIGSVLVGTNYYTLRNLDYNTAYKYKVKVVMSSTGIISQNSADTSFTSHINFAPCLVLGGKSFYGAAIRPQAMSEPFGGMIYNGKLYNIDAKNHRIQIWNSIPTTTNAEPDVVIGQNKVMDGASVLGFTISSNHNGLNNSAVTAKGLNEPYDLWVGSVGGVDKMVVADGLNNRVLIWNTIPTVSFTAADVVVGQPSKTTNTANNGGPTKGLSAPLGVFSDGTKLYVTDRSNNRVLIYNTFPVSDYPSPDTYLGQTSTTGTSTGCSAGKFNSPRYARVYDGKLIVSEQNNNRVKIWNNASSIPSASQTILAADVVIGQIDFNTCATLREGADGLEEPNQTAYFHDGGVNPKFYIADAKNNRVQVFNGIPTAATGATAAYAIGPSSTTDAGTSAAATYLNYPRGVIVSPDGATVIVADTNNHRLNFYNPAPTATGATPNFFIGKVVAGFNGRNAMAADKTNFLAPYGMLLKGTQMFVADTGNHRVLVWNGIPTTNDTAPNFAIGQQDVDTVTFPSGSSAQNTLNSPRGLCASSNKLFVTESGNHRVSIYNLPITGNQPNAIAVLGQPTYLDNSSCAATSKGCFNQAWGCFYDEVSDELFVTDRNNHRIIYWQNFMTNFEAGPDPMDGGASDAKQFLGTWVFGSNDATSACSATKLNTPIGVWADATNLWIADTGNKRVVGFNRNITSDTPTQLITLGETTNSSCGGGTTQALLSNSIGVISVSGKIYTANSNSRRVVMWDNPTADGEPMTSVMGQINFTNSNYGESGSQVPMSNPEFLYTDGKRIFQSDSVTNKISIYPLFN